MTAVEQWFGAHFADLHHAGLFVVALLLAGTWFAEPLPAGRDDAAFDEVPSPTDESLQPSAAPTTDPAR